MTDEYTADEVRNVIDKLYDEEFEHTDDVVESVEGFVRDVVEEGTFTPDSRLYAELSLPIRDRLTGSREQDVTAIVIIGMIIGAALENDVPTGTKLEEAWLKGEFTLPDD